MEHADTAQIAAVAGALGAVVVLLARRRLALLTGFALLGGAEGALALSLSGGGVLDEVASPAGALGVALAAATLGAAAALLARRPGLVPAVVLAAAPLRPPLQYDASSPLLIGIAEDGRLGRLLPLYFVLVASTLALGWRTVRGVEVRPLPSVIAAPAAAFFGLAFLSLVWARDVEAGANLLVFFTLPFTVLLAVVGRAPFPPWLPPLLGRIAIGLAAVFAAVGLWQAATRKLFFFAPNLEISNANSSYFRVTSLFGDPSLYGRHVVLGLCVVLVLLALGRINRPLAIGAVILLWAGLLFSYSQSSMSALIVATLAIAAATGDRRVRQVVALAVVGAAVAAAGLVAAQVALDGAPLNRVTSDRTDRIEEAARVVGEHPVAGVGVGGQPRASRELAHSDRPTADFVSHTTPVTVAAELGILGLAVYGWLLIGGARLIESARRRDEPLALCLGAAFLALFVHALFYSGFLEDPLTWVVLAVGASALSARRTAKARVDVQRRGEQQPAAALQ